MRFVCDSCRAQYMISDDKVGAKGVKVRCKKCNHVILVRKPEAGAESSDESSRGAGASPEDAMATAEVPAVRNGAASADALLGNVEDDEIGAVFDQVLNKTGPAAASEPVSDDSGTDELESTRVVSLDALKRMAEDAESQGRPAGDSGKPDSSVPTTDWYVAVREEQVGPLTLERVKELWDRGEVGAESLCWRAGFADWIPLSEVKDLKAVLAPRPAKPVIVAPAAVVAPSPAPGPVESAFTAGSSSYAPSKSAPAPQAATPSPSDTGAWTPSAASALASLAQQEVESFSKPAPKPVAAPEPMAMAANGLLDLPPPEPAPVAAPQPRNTYSQLPVMDEPEPPRARPQPSGYSSASAPYPQPTYDAYRPPAPQPLPPAPSGGNKNALIGVVGAIGLAVIVGLVVVVVLRPTAQVVPQEQLARVQPAPVQPAPTAVQPAPVQPAPTVTPQPAPAQPVAVAPTPTPPVVPAPAPAQPAPAQPVAVAPAQPASTPSATEVVKADSTKPDRDSSSSKRNTKHTSSDRDRGSSSSRSETVASNDPPPTKRSSSSSSGGGDDFDKEFGGDSGSSKSSSKSNSDSGSKKSGYIPPAPGSGDVPDKLGNSDVMQVVKAHIPELKTCTSEQKRKNPDLSGTLVMRWTIMPSGRTTSVQVRSDQFKSTYIAGCISGLVKSWSFPKHRVQGDPIDFPFNF